MRLPARNTVAIAMLAMALTSKQAPSKGNGEVSGTVRDATGAVLVGGSGTLHGADRTPRLSTFFEEVTVSFTGEVDGIRRRGNA